ncbi:phorbol-12-myristate-13-acetate-induced protein 1 [Triplophysa dalaica]|nr:phorbol-12-myristate-13-acetate-induced protein 1 [Triplophysa dalaica]
MAKKEQAAVVECALQLRRFGDVFNWKYKILELIVTLKNLHNDDKR